MLRLSTSALWGEADIPEPRSAPHAGPVARSGSKADMPNWRVECPLMTLSRPQDAVPSASRARADHLSDVGRLSARHDEIGDLDLHSLIILIQRRCPHFDQSLI